MSDTIVFNTEESLKINTLPTEAVKVPVFDLVPENHSILKEVMPEFDFNNPPVNSNEFASSLVETCIKHKGYGLSANQCGFKYRVFVMGAGDNYVAFFNPKVIKEYDTTHMIEGCLSFPLLALGVTRAAAIDVEYQDYTGAIKTAHYTGISARCFLHELDHMNGIVYTSRAKPLALQQGIKKRGKIFKKVLKVI
jgi:peptide deformylase